MECKIASFKNFDFDIYKRVDGSIPLLCAAVGLATACPNPEARFGKAMLIDSSLVELRIRLRPPNMVNTFNR
tara:strand:- start:200 stop:415 length:216 start_codon:yes stop_codon:yes gene_type:complete